MSTDAKVVRCRDVYLAVSSYLENDVDPEFRRIIEEHLPGCEHCSAIYDGTKNVLRLVADGRTFDVPSDFGKRLYTKLQSAIDED